MKKLLLFIILIIILLFGFGFYKYDFDYKSYWSYLSSLSFDKVVQNIDLRRPYSFIEIFYWTMSWSETETESWINVLLTWEQSTWTINETVIFSWESQSWNNDTTNSWATNIESKSEIEWYLSTWENNVSWEIAAPEMSNQERLREKLKELQQQQ